MKARRTPVPDNEKAPASNRSDRGEVDDAFAALFRPKAQRVSTAETRGVRNGPECTQCASARYACSFAVSVTLIMAIAAWSIRDETLVAGSSSLRCFFFDRFHCEKSP